MKKSGKINRSILFLTILLVVGGFFIFSSASLGVLAKDEAKFSNVAFNQIFFGLFLGSIACIITTRVNYQYWKKYSLIIFIIGMLLTIMVFIPGIGVKHGGASRWIDLGFITFQPSEILKIGFIVYFAAWLARLKKGIETFSWGLVPFIIFLVVAGGILLAQPDTDTFAVIVFASLTMYIISGANLKHIFIIFVLGVITIASLAIFRPYIRERIEVMINPSSDIRTSGYQLNQSLIAIGSGGLWGRGFGQSVQKFRYLPEPIGDSIFAVAAEEFGFIGASILVLIFIIFTIQGLKIASNAPDDFARLLASGIVIMIVSQAFINICGMLGLLPLTGIPLPFISHGGTALFITLIEAGILMNISRYSR